VAFDAVGEGQVGAWVLRRGVGEFDAERGQCLAPSAGAGGIEPDVQCVARDLQVTGQGERFTKQ